jgi:aspartate aminotransferase-like enzyme
MSPLFIPGPVDVDSQVMGAQLKPMLPHRSKEFEDLFWRASERLRQLFYTRYRVFITASSGSGLQEAAVRNLAKETVLSCVNGAFAERWYTAALANGKRATRLDFPWNQPVSPDAVADALLKQHYEVVTIIHNETSTGLENPVREVAAVVREVSPDTLVCVDAVSSLGGVKIEMDAWGLDMLLTSSQKCLGLPPGLALGGVSDRALAYASSVPNRGWYFDLVLMEQHRLKDSTPATPAISLIYALDYQIERILAEGLERRFARHAALARRVQDWALKSELALFAPHGFRSKTVTTVDNRLRLDVSALNSFLLQKDMRIADGYGALKGKTFRIAHMGDMQMEQVDLLLAAMDDYLRSH